MDWIRSRSSSKSESEASTDPAPRSKSSVVQVLSKGVHFIAEMEEKAVLTLAAPKLARYAQRRARVHEPVPEDQQLQALIDVANRVTAVCSRLGRYDREHCMYSNFASYVVTLSDWLSAEGENLPYIRLQVLYEHLMHAELSLTEHLNRRWTRWVFDSTSTQLEDGLNFLRESANNYLLRCEAFDQANGRQYGLSVKDYENATEE